MLKREKFISNNSYLIIFVVVNFTACSENEPPIHDNEFPVVKAENSYTVMVDEDIIYANGLILDANNSAEMPQLLDVYYPDNNSTNRPVYMFIHGGGFQGGTKTKPEIIHMANYFASRGWIFASVDYRTTSDLNGSDFKGIAPQEWIDFTL